MTMNRTFDGKPMTGSVTGFTEYTTLRKEQGSSYPAPVVTPEDALKAIRHLETLFDTEQIDKALTALYDHISDLNNPHQTQLDQFTQTVADIFYKEYKAHGGTASREQYFEALFDTLRVASLAEMYESNDRRLLISVKGAKEFLLKHELDSNAHSSLFERILPGNPPRHTPTFSVMGAVGIAPFNSYYAEPTYTYVGLDGMIHKCMTGIIPTDYAWGAGMFPCFKETTNYIADSNNFTKCAYSNCTYVAEAEVSPMGDIDAYAIFSNIDSTEVEHKIRYPQVDLPTRKASAFSVHVKKEEARYFAISFKDFYDSDVTVHAVFDLEEYKCQIFNGMNRYFAQMQKLGYGWYRCILSMYHPVGQISSMDMCFFKEKQRDFNMAFQGNQDLLGYVWGMQFEHNRTASPYIATTGSPVTREAIGYDFCIDNTKWSKYKYSVHVDYQPAPFDNNEECKHPVFAARDCATGEIALSVFEKNKQMYFEHYRSIKIDDETNHVSTATQTVFDLEEVEELVKVTHSYEYNKQLKSTYHFHSREIPDDILVVSDYNKLQLGYDGKDYLDGYIRNIFIYPCIMTDDNLKYLHEVDYYG